MTEQEELELMEDMMQEGEDPGEVPERLWDASPSITSSDYAHVWEKVGFKDIESKLFTNGNARLVKMTIYVCKNCKKQICCLPAEDPSVDNDDCVQSILAEIHEQRYVHKAPT